MKLALKIDVDTLAGTRDGVPELLRVLDRHGVRATFLFSLGPDHTGRAIRRIFRRGFFQKVRRTSVVSHYGWRTLLYGTLLPGPDIGRLAADVMRSVADSRPRGRCPLLRSRSLAGQRRQRGRRVDAAADRPRLRAIRRDLRPPCRGARSGRLADERRRIPRRVGSGVLLRVGHAGTLPHWPVIDGLPVACLQLPTTLPTLDELIGRDDLPEASPVADVDRRHRTRRRHGTCFHAPRRDRGRPAARRVRPAPVHLASAGLRAGHARGFRSRTRPGQSPELPRRATGPCPVDRDDWRCRGGYGLVDGARNVKVPRFLRR